MLNYLFWYVHTWAGLLSSCNTYFKTNMWSKWSGVYFRLLCWLKLHTWLLQEHGEPVCSKLIYYFIQKSSMLGSRLIECTQINMSCTLWTNLSACQRTFRPSFSQVCSPPLLPRHSMVWFWVKETHQQCWVSVPWTEAVLRCSVTNTSVNGMVCDGWLWY